MRSLCLLLVLFSGVLHAQSSIEAPKTADPNLEVSLFAAEPMIQQPIGCTIDKHGRLLVIESHTHFRPKDWKGPEHDQIVMLMDTNGDGASDKREVFFDQTDMTMDIATHPDGAIYLSTRNEILRLRDDDGDGKPEKVERKLVWLESTGRYPHNGLSGLAFDAKGDLYFGMGENLGAPYSLTGSDGSSESDEGEGGNVWHVTKDGGRLTRIATGFWNAFGVCVDPWGNVFATDNDPDSSPPCRLHHIIRGGDYGYQFRYGRTGLHPFVSWNGQRMGTLPMLSGTGESPCDIIFYEGAAYPQYRGLGTNWAGTLLLTSWVDHRVECYKLTPGKGTFTAKRQILLQGGGDFRPVAFAVAADGTLFLTDWVKRNYELHGMGRVWRIAAKAPQEMTEALAKPYQVDAKTQLRERIESGAAPSISDAVAWLASEDPYLYAAAVERLSREPGIVTTLVNEVLPEASQRGGTVLAARRGLKREGLTAEAIPAAHQALIRRTLKDADPKVVLLALHWIADERLAAFKQPVEQLLTDEALPGDVFYAAITTLARLEKPNPSETDLIMRLKDTIADPKTRPERVRSAVEMIPGVDRFMTADEVNALIVKSEPKMAEWFTQLLGLMAAPTKQPKLRAIAFDKQKPDAVRAAAITHLNVTAEDADALTGALDTGSAALKRAVINAFLGVPVPADISARLQKAAQEQGIAPLVDRQAGKPFFTAGRPALTDIAGWRNFLNSVPGGSDPQHGREVFFSPKLGACAMCHSMDGMGSRAGPNLAQIHAATTPNYALESLLQPNANVAPQFESFVLVTSDGQTRTAFQLQERGGNHLYIDLTGKPFEVKIEDIIRRDQLPVSIMPEGIVSRLTDVEIRDLMAYLERPERLR